MEKRDLKAFLPDEVTKTIVTKLSKDSLEKLQYLSKYYKSSYERVISGLIAKEYAKSLSDRLLGKKVKRYCEENKNKSKLIFTVLPSVKTKYDELTENDNSFSKSSFVESWIKEAYQEIVVGEKQNEI